MTNKDQSFNWEEWAEFRVERAGGGYRKINPETTTTFTVVIPESSPFARFWQRITKKLWP